MNIRRQLQYRYNLAKKCWPIFQINARFKAWNLERRTLKNQGSIIANNHYMVWPTNKCNLKCDYCINRENPIAKNASWIEKNVDALIELFEAKEPAAIHVTGGEPFIWEDLRTLIVSLPKHKWIILSNCSIIPDWLTHNPPLLVLAAYHSGQIKKTIFLKNVTALKKLGVRVCVKIMTCEQTIKDSFSFQDEALEMGIPAHLCPIMGSFISSEILDEIRTKRLTSCMYMSRYYPVVTKGLYGSWCKAGSKDMFQIMPTGEVVACSSCLEDEISHVDRGIFRFEGTKCCQRRCICEWHEWAGMTPANENQRWDLFLSSGIWEMPSHNEFEQYLANLRG